MADDDVDGTWLGFPPKVNLVYEELNGFLLSCTMQFTKDPDRGVLPEQQLQAIFFKQMQTAGVFAQLPSLPRVAAAPAELEGQHEGQAAGAEEPAEPVKVAARGTVSGLWGAIVGAKEKTA